MKFSDLQLEPSLLASIEKLGYAETTPIQSAVFPHVLEGKDLSGLAQTGTGKTAAFLIPLMDRILKGKKQNQVIEPVPSEEAAPEGAATTAEEQKGFMSQRSFADWNSQNFILILVPTRELAEQVHENVLQLGEGSGLRGVSVYGGTGYDKQKEAFKNQVEFVVATPGRLIDLYKEHFVDLKQVRGIVFDEADRMFDMGFKEDMKYVLSRVPRERQFLVFSATLNFDVLNTAYQFGAEPVEIDVSRDQTKAENVKDELFHVGHHDKPMYLLSLLKKHNPKQAIIFSNFKHNVERVARFLSDNGVPAMGISSLLTQAQRTRVMEQFRAENEKNILVATDVAARGLDIKGVDMVINYELPQDAESYVHRIGRTGRAGAEGRAFSLVSDRDVESLTRVEDYLKHKVDIGWIEESELIKGMKPMPREDFNSDGGGRPFDRAPASGRGGNSPQRAERGPRVASGTGDRGPRDQKRASGRNGTSPERGPRREHSPRENGPGEPRKRESGKGPQVSPAQISADGTPAVMSRPQPRTPGQAPHPGRRPQHSNGDSKAHAAAGAKSTKRQSKHPHSKDGYHKSGPTSKKAPPGLLKRVSRFFKKLLGD